MSLCSFNVKDGRCGVDAGVGKRKCPPHRGLKCQICGKAAWKECRDLTCTTVLCHNRDCLRTHVDKNHQGEVPKTEKETPVEKFDSTASVKQHGKDITEEVGFCPFCEPTQTKHLLQKKTTKAEGRRGHLQVVCAGCGMAGPLRATETSAIADYNKLPRAQLAPYATIRITALKTMEREVERIEKASVEKKLKPEECTALAKMSEAATMMVDTWEI